MPSSDFVAYYEERAAGGVGLLFHSVPILPRGRAALVYQDALPPFRAVAEAVHRHGAKLFAQLYTYYGTTIPWEPNGAMFPTVGVSTYQRFDPHDTVRELSIADIEELIALYARSAENLRAVGYDGIEMHATHAMLHEQFLSPYYNKRLDRYGGDLDGRMRFLVETLRAVRAAVGPGLAVGTRLMCDEMLPGGLTQDDLRQILSRLIAMGLLDYVDLDIGVEPSQVPSIFPAHFSQPLGNASFVESVGRAAKGKIPVLATGPRVATAADAERLIADGIVDMAGAVRGLLAEPQLMKNAREGREAQSRTCIACNICIPPLARLRTGWGCAINPATMRERHWGSGTWTAAPRRSKVVVVGGGIAGLEAAVVAARRGHRVVLIERRPTLGGQFSLWAGLPGREVMTRTREWYKARLAELGVSVLLRTEATVERILSERPDAVVVATGARYSETGESGFMPVPIPGWDRRFVYTPEQVLEGGARPGGRVLVLDDEGMNTGVGIAEVLARAGARVELVTRDFSSISPYILLTMQFVAITPRLRSLGVVTTSGTYVKEIGDGRVTLFDVLTNEEFTREVDAVVLSTMRRPLARLAEELEGKVAQLYVVGDALAPRTLFEATYEGHRFARLIGEPDAPRSMTEAMFRPMDAGWAGAAARPLEPVPS